ncbi:unnamed protein product [Allacma fusca]|uniref:Uncharacterized protein n=1 Tax=Allacma fusca TaxID=39272 RepID=A0A8J2K2V4_9HEXA|nr:unnamed protein product [Allacma fusca]
MNEKRKSSGIAITAVLQLLALLQILLCFCSLGITLRVICINSYYKRNFLMQDSSDGSYVTKKEIAGQEYEAKTDRLLCWLGYQKRQYFTRQLKTTAQSVNRHPVRPQLEPRLYTRLIPARAPAVQIPLQQHCNSLVFPKPYAIADPRSILAPHGLPPLIPFRAPLIMSLVPFPKCRPRSLGPPSIDNSSIKRRKVVSYCVNSLQDKRTGNALLQMSDDKSHEVITEEEVEKTYTGLDREIAEKFISNTMNSH